MKKVIRLLASIALASTAASSMADTPDAAKALLDAAVAEVKTSGFDGAVRNFNAGGKWKPGSLYLVVVDFQGKMLAHSANDKMPGKVMLEAKDAGGKAFVQEAIAASKTTGAAAIDLRWGNPQTKQIADATMFVKRVPGQDAYVGSVVFK